LKEIAMSGAVAEVRQDTVEVLYERLHRGAEILFTMEQQGDMGPDYVRWLQRWTELLEQYEASAA
jgi:hypothetical protein